jgi:phenylacetate-CoA ligase
MPLSDGCLTIIKPDPTSPHIRTTIHTPIAIMDASQLSFIQFVQAYSPFYANLYKDIPVSPSTSLSDLPIVPPAGYWAANTSSTSTNTVRTSPLVDGVIFKTGGTTSKPKATAYSQAELQRTTNLLGAGLVAAGLRSGDCVANLFYAGEMWGSFREFLMGPIDSLPMCR